MSRHAVSAVAILTLAACQTSDEGPLGPLTQSANDLTTTQPEATSSVSVFSYAGTEFPMAYVFSGPADLNGFQGFQKRGVGRVTFDSTLETLTIQFEDGGEALVLDLAAAGSTRRVYQDDTSVTFADVTTNLAFLPSAVAAGVSFSDRRRDLYPADAQGIIGFATPSGAIPGSGTATFQSPASSVPPGNSFFFIAEGEEIRTSIAPDRGAMNITVDFDSGSVTGQLFAGDTIIDYEGAADNFSDNDRLALQLALQNGELTNGALTGTVSLAGTVDIKEQGTDIRNLSPAVTTSAVDGRLFGDSAQALGGTYGGEATVTGADGAPVAITFGGTFLGEQ